MVGARRAVNHRVTCKEDPRDVDTGESNSESFTSNIFLTMDNALGLLKVRVQRGINLAVRDTRSSDPYVVVTMGNQKLKTHVIKNNCNPQWNTEMTLVISNFEDPISLTVYDKDTLTVDDKMGQAEIDIKPYIDCLKMDLKDLPNGCVVKRVQPNRTNCLADESNCVWNDGKIIQDMCLRLKNVECGEVVVQIEWIDVPGSKGLGALDKC